MNESNGKTDEELAFLHTLGLRVRESRARAALTRRQLSERSGLSERYLAQLESGAGNISILLIRRVALALGVDLARLVGEGREAVLRRTRIALTGLRGAGKSTLGANLATRLKVPFIELDQEVERELGASLENIFVTYGQDTYRDAERRVLHKVTDANPRCVIATGGSLVVEPQTYEALRERCFTVWLKATPEDHMNRVIAQGDLRPIRGREHAMSELRTILGQRERLYALADATIDTSATEIGQCADQLHALVADAFSGKPAAARRESPATDPAA